MRRAGFTLIELLVVIAVIAMLIGVLMRVLHTTRQQARAVACGSNLKQLALALTIYDQGNGTFPHGFDDLTYGMTPPPGGYVGTAMYDGQGWWWFHFLTKILGQEFGRGTVVWCPSRCINDFGPKPNVLCGNYGVNRAVCKDAQGILSSGFIGRPLSAHKIRPPESTLLIVDSGYSLISWWGATDAPGQPFENTQREGAFYLPGLWINKARNLCTGHEQDAVDGRHPNRSVNAAFVDGHIGRVEADDLFVWETNGNYSNRSPLWLPK